MHRKVKELIVFTFFVILYHFFKKMTRNERKLYVLKKYYFK
jgi:hypothetical protein